jgi:formate hydrogenlyase subunit 4
VIFPVSTGHWLLNGVMAFLGMMGLAVLIGVVESTMARLRLLIVPQLLIGAGALAGVAFILTLR